MDETQTPPDEAEQDLADTPDDTRDDTVSGHDQPPLPLVGIGASADSIGALQAFFEALPPDPGLAFAVVMHPTPEPQGGLAEALQRATRMPVRQVQAPCTVEPDTVYVIAPGKALRTGDGLLRPAELPPQRARHAAVDLFFRTLAETHGPHATAIVLSGTDGDGAVGIQRIKERGGLTIAQALQPGHGDMPRAALSTDMVDWVLPAEDMPARLIDFHQRRRRRHPRLPAEGEPRPAPATQQADGNEEETALREVLALLQSRTGREFAGYKRATVLRRVGRRMQVNGIDDLPAYLGCLRTRPDEADALLQDLLISVTNFFRDADCFAALEAHLHRAFEGKGADDTVRVWVVACATGEEAYSVAILLAEFARRMQAPPRIQVFASDLDDQAIRTAREGCYGSAIEADVSEERLHRYFTRRHDGYRVRREVREMVLFAVHDVLKDSPFSRLDLLTCRNLLIYLNRDAQRQVFDTLHFSLRPGGLMLLGASESVAADSPQFAVVDKPHRLYAQQPTRRSARPPPAGRGPTALASDARQPARAVSASAGPAGAALRVPPAGDGPAASWAELHLHLLEKVAPPSILVDAAHDIVHLSASAGAFLRHAGGEPSRNLPRSVHPGLRVGLRAALYQAAERGEAVEVPPVAVDIDGAETLLRVKVVPVADLAPGFLLVVLQADAATPALLQARVRDAAAADPVAQHLDRELERMKSHLQETVQQYELSTEELKAGNEELQAMNEELRSASEELETSREELQFINEQLSAVNQELKGKVDELGQANSDMHNLMDATAIATVFLDRALCITRFTPSAVSLFKLIATDVGRPLSDLATHLDYPGLADDARRVLERLVPIEREVGKAGGQWFLVRTRPYRTLDDRIAGVVLTLVDVTERKREQAALRASQERFSAIVNQAAAGVVEVAPDGRIAFANRSYRDMLGYGAQEVLALPLLDMFHPDDRSAVAALFRQLALDGEPFQVEARRLRKDGTVLWTFNSVSRLSDASGRQDAALVMCIDITERKKVEDDLSRSEERLRLIVENAVEFAIFSTDPDMRITRWNIGAQRLLGYAEAEVLGLSADIIFTAEDRAAGAPQHEMRQALVEGRGADDRLHRRKDGSTFWASGALMPMLADGAVVGFVKILRDQSQARRSRHELEQSRAELVEALREKQLAHEALQAADAAKDRFLAVLSHELRNPLASIRSAAHAMGSGRLDSAARQQAAEIVIRQSAAMKSLLDDLLDISRLRLGRMVLHRAPVALAAVVQSGVEATAPMLEAAGHRLEVSLPEAPVLLDADAVRLSQVLSNLLANAARYTPPGGRIVLQARADATELEITVEDNGIGLPADSIESMFEMFAQQSGGQAAWRGPGGRPGPEIGLGIGLGIGLALVRDIMELHGGTVEGFSPGPGQGCRFTLRMPLPRDAGQAPEPVRTPPVAADAPLPGYRVMVVDDNADAAWGIATLLQIAGCDVRTAGSGQAALALARIWWPEVVVLDIGLPDLSGHEAARQLRALEGGADLLVIAATGWGQASDRQAALDAGFDAHLVKPVDQDALRSLIADFHRRKA